jgi:hypothetical protein
MLAITVKATRSISALLPLFAVLISPGEQVARALFRVGKFMATYDTASPSTSALVRRVNKWSVISGQLNELHMIKFYKTKTRCPIVRSCLENADTIKVNLKLDFRVERQRVR